MRLTDVLIKELEYEVGICMKNAFRKFLAGVGWKGRTRKERLTPREWFCRGRDRISVYTYDVRFKALGTLLCRRDNAAKTILNMTDHKSSVGI